MNDRYDVRDVMRADWAVLLLIGLMIVAGLWAYPRLPEQVPSHWNIRGEVDKYQGRFWGAFSMPLTALSIYFGMVLLPLVDPHRRNYAKFTGPYRLIRWAAIGFFAVMYIAILASAMGYRLRMDLIVNLSIGVLLLLLGNVMGKVKHNWFVGIRTPWTLSDPDVWRATHRVSSWVWSLTGVIVLVSALLSAPYNFLAMFVAIMLATLFSVVYSYIAFRSRHPDGRNS